MQLNIIKYPDNFLRGRSKKVSRILNLDIQDLIVSMKESMLANNGIGLAGRQIGRQEDIFIVNIGTEILTFINSQIIYRSIKKIDTEEGCLSIPGVYGLVNRSRSVMIKYYDEQGQLKIKKFSDMPAIIVQHEYDHNRGILFIDKTKKYTQGYNLIKDIKE